MLGLGLLLILAALASLSVAVLEPGKYRIAASRRRPVQQQAHVSVVDTAVHRISGVVDQAIRRGSWAPFTALELEMAGINASVGFMVVSVSAGSLFALGALWVGTGGILLGVLGAVLVPVVLKVVLGQRSAKRRKLFGEQLDATLQMLASALRAGHSLPRALDTTSRDAPSPTAEELGRIINETRIGRDLVESMHTTAVRMQSEDFHWVAEAVAVQRDTGGNLNEVLDRVGGTIRERGSLMREVHALSSEGRMSAIVLSVLPLFVGAVMMVMSPGYMDPLLHSFAGVIVGGVSLVLFAAGTLWMRAILNVKI